MAMRTQRGHRTKDQVQAKEAKRQRRDEAGQWIASKGNDMMVNDEAAAAGGVGEVVNRVLEVVTDLLKVHEYSIYPWK